MLGICLTDLTLKVRIVVQLNYVFVVHMDKDQTVHGGPCLTHLSLASLLWDIGKQNSPRCDAAERGVPPGAILFA